MDNWKRRREATANPFVFSEEEVRLLLEHMIAITMHGFPMDSDSLSTILTAYISRVTAEAAMASLEQPTRMATDNGPFDTPSESERHQVNVNHFPSPSSQLGRFNCGDYVILNYQGALCPAIVTRSSDPPTTIRVFNMTNESGYWVWPLNVVELEYEIKDIVSVISPPRLVRRREYFSVPELDRMAGCEK